MTFFFYTCLTTVRCVACFMTAIALGKAGISEEQYHKRMTAECLRDAQMQKSDFLQNSDPWQNIRKKERLGIILVHENLIFLQEAETSILWTHFPCRKKEVISRSIGTEYHVQWSK